jgi:hypothetical protein
MAHYELANYYKDISIKSQYESLLNHQLVTGLTMLHRDKNKFDKRIQIRIRLCINDDTIEKVLVCVGRYKTCGSMERIPLKDWYALSDHYLMHEWPN